MKWLLYFVLFGVVIGSALGASAVDISPVTNQISSSEIAQFALTISNTESVPVRYTTYSLQNGIGWSVDPEPLRDKIIELQPGERHVTTINVKPLQDYPPGIYRVALSVESDQGQRKDLSMKIYMASDRQVDYLPAVNVVIDMDDKITPKQPVSVKLFLDNRNPLNLTNLLIRMQSDIAEFNKEVTIDLPPLEKKTVEFTIVPNAFEDPQKHTIFFVFERFGETVKIVEQQVEFVALLPAFTLEINEETKFLKTWSSVAVLNDGNVRNTQDVRVPVSLWRGLFTRSEGKVVADESGRFLEWEVSLSPNESKTLVAVTNYRLVLYICLVLLAFGLFYWYVQSPIQVRKGATATASEDGTLSAIKVTLELRNRGKTPLQDIMITDLVPGIANVERHLELGTVKPHEIVHLRKGTRIVWKLAEIDGLEHRLITYKIKAKLGIVGTLSFPRVTVTYKKGKKQGKVYSNVFRLSG